MTKSFVDFFFFNDTATTEIYTLSLHDALPIFYRPGSVLTGDYWDAMRTDASVRIDRKSTRLNSSHSQISYAVFCLKKKNKPRLLIKFSSCNTSVFGSSTR